MTARSHTLLLLVLLCVRLSAQTTWHVDGSAAGPGSGTSSSPFPEIHMAAAVAQSGDTVLVAPGTYRWFVVTTGITVRGREGAQNTLVDGAGQRTAIGVSVTSGTAVLERLTLTNGRGGPYGPVGGLEVLGGSVRVHDCIVSGNFGETAPSQNDGGPGGVSVRNGQAEFERCLITGNVGGAGGAGLSLFGWPGGPGGVLVSGGAVATFRECVVTSNTGGSGGAGGVICAPACTPLPGGSGGVGGLDIRSGYTTLSRCIVSANTGGSAFFGIPGVGGVAAGNGDTITSSVIHQNLPGAGGTVAGLSLGTGYAWMTPIPTLVINSTISANLGVGITTESNMIAGTSVANSIVFGNTGGAINAAAAALPVTYSDVEGGFSGAGNISSDPMFRNSILDVHLSPGSPCIDAGSSTVIGLPLVDLDNQTRTFRNAPDMGADESVLTLSFDQASPGAPVTLHNEHLVLGNETFNLISLELCPTGPGNGPLLGLCATSMTSFQFLVDQALSPVTSGPTHFLATAYTQSFGPFSVTPLTIEALSFDASANATSDVVRFAIQ